MRSDAGHMYIPNVGHMYIHAAEWLLCGVVHLLCGAKHLSPWRAEAEEEPPVLHWSIGRDRLRSNGDLVALANSCVYRRLVDTDTHPAPASVVTHFGLAILCHLLIAVRWAPRPGLGGVPP